MTRILDHKRLTLRGAGTMRAVVRIEVVGRRRMRLFACGHRVPLPDGGGAKDAQQGRCKQCLKDELQSVPLGEVRFVEIPARAPKNPRKKK